MLYVWLRCVVHIIGLVNGSRTTATWMSATQDKYHLEHIEFSTFVASKAISTSQGAAFMSKFLNSQRGIANISSSPDHFKEPLLQL